MTITDFLLPCLGCGSLSSGVSGLCDTCQRNILVELKPATLRLQGAIPVHYLFLWEAEQKSLLGEFLTGLKGGRRRKIFQFLANLIVVGHPLPRRAQLVPVPGSGPSRNHALALASALPIGGPIIRIKRLTEREQKDLSRVERSSVRFECTEKITSGDPVLFVDDIMTTGHSLISAWKSLGAPQEAAAIVLAYRRPLAGK